MGLSIASLAFVFALSAVSASADPPPGQAAPPSSAPAPSPAASGDPAVPASAGAAAHGPAEQDLDAFMARVLQHRDETWRKLPDYILDEREKFELRGPGDVTLFGQQRTYNWYVREGYLVRSPVKFNGVSLDDAARRKYEQDWLREEKDRERAQADRRLRGAKAAQARRDGGAAPGPFDTGAPVQAGIDDVLRDGLEPRFVSEAYFLKFRFEPGNYYLAGRERLDDQEVLKIEYYPQKRMFENLEDNPEKENRPPKSGNGKAGAKGEESDRNERIQDEFERKFNKVSLVTLWIDPVAHQIVRYTFVLPDFGFLPGRWMARVDDATASMTMGRVAEGVWLPRELGVEGGFTLATGGYRFRYGRVFSDYKLGDVRAKIRGYDAREP